MAVSKTAESTVQIDTGSLGDASQATAPTRAESIPETSLAITPPPTFVGSGKTANFTFTETADEPNVHVTAEGAARLEDNSLLTCLKKQHRKTIEEREAFLVYFAETVRRFSRLRLRDANGKFVSDGKLTLPEAFAAIGLSFEAEQKRSERYKKQLKELAELAAPALTDGSKESPKFSLGEEAYYAGADSSATFYVVGRDGKSGTYHLLSSDGNQELKKVSPEDLAPVDRPAAHTLKDGGRYVDTATGREFVYDGDGGLKRIVLPRAVQQVLDKIRQRDLDAAIAKATKGVPTAEEKAAQKSRRQKEAEERDRKKIKGNEAKKGKTKRKAVATAITPAKTELVKVARIGDTKEFGVFPDSCSEYTTAKALTIGTREMCEAERDRINEERLGKNDSLGNAPDAAKAVAQKSLPINQAVL
jgi:hypothetical protein